MRKTILVFLIVLTNSCVEKQKKPTEPSLDYDKIDALLGNDVSQVLFNHLYVVFDSISYAQLTQKAPWRNTYSSIDKGLPDFEIIDEKTTSCYLRGHKHYIEILGPENNYQEPVGKSGIGFSLRNKGEHFHIDIKPKLKQGEIPYLSISEIVNMPLGKYKTTWFKAFYSPGTPTNLHTWYAFYNPVFLDSLYYGEQHNNYSRESFLRKPYDKERLFEGIKSVSMTCTPKDYERIAQEMKNLGCELLKKEDKTLTIASGDVSITITPSNTIEHSRITQIRCRLNAEDNSVTELGNLTITNQGTESIWHLENLYKNNP